MSLTNMRESVKEGKNVTTLLGSLVPLLRNLHPSFLYAMPSSLLCFLHFHKISNLFFTGRIGKSQSHALLVENPADSPDH